MTISELRHAVASALRSPSDGASGDRDAPNERAIRWYATIGLVDPPLSRRGRTARYGRRHLLQLLAIKHRQAQGRTLAEIQAELLGSTDAALEAIVGAAGEPVPASPPRGGPETTEPAPPRERFWAHSPGVRARPDSAPPDRTHVDPPAATHVTGVRLAPGVTLVFDAAPRPLSASDAAELRAAAAELMHRARARGLADPNPTTQGGPP